MLIQENVALAPLTTFKVGGPARFFLEAKTVDHVLAGVEFSRAQNLPLFVLGGGSNLVVSDAGWPGLVLKIAVGGIDESNQGGLERFEVGAGEEWDKFVSRAVARNCAGVECLSGIPGSVGGTPVQNVGAYGQEVAEVVESVLALDLKDVQLRELCREACGFSYRSSIFNSSERGRYVIVRVTYALTPDGEPRIQYADLKKHFAGWKKTPTLPDAREAVRSDDDALPVTQNLLAEMLGVHRPTITNAARELECAGLIERGRRQVTIVDRHGLMEASCECYQLLRTRVAFHLPKTYV